MAFSKNLSDQKNSSKHTVTYSDTIVVGKQTQTTPIPVSLTESVLGGSSQANIGVESAQMSLTSQTSDTNLDTTWVEDAMDLDQSTETLNSEYNEALVTSITIVEDPKLLVHDEDDAQTSEPKMRLSNI